MLARSGRVITYTLRLGSKQVSLKLIKYVFIYIHDCINNVEITVILRKMYVNNICC